MRDRRTPPTWREVRWGLLLLAAVLMIAGAIFFIDHLRRSVADGPRLVLVATEVPGLERGSDVWVAGRPAGRVTTIRLRDPVTGPGLPVIIETVIDAAVAPLIRRDASARIGPGGLMGPAVVDLRPGSPHAPPFDFADTLRARAVGSRELVLARLDTLAAAAERASPAARELSRLLAEGRGSLPSLRRDPELVRSLRADLHRLGELMAAAEERGSLGPLLRDTAWRAAMERSAARLRKMTESGAPPEADGPPPLSASDLAAALAGVAVRIEALEARLEEGRGTVSRALRDRALQEQVDLFQARLDSVRAELAAEPLRWLRLRPF